MTSNSIKIRKATTSDIPRLVQILQTSFPTAPEWNAPRFLIRSWWKKIICNNHCQTLIAADGDDNARGFVIYVESAHVWSWAEKLVPYSKASRLVLLLLKPSILRSRIAKQKALINFGKNQKTIAGTSKHFAATKKATLSNVLAADFFVGLIAVDNTFRGHGAGVKLLGESEKLAQKRGSMMVRMHIDPRNHKAHRFYESMGYRHAGRIKNSIVMVKKLS